MRWHHVNTQSIKGVNTPVSDFNIDPWVMEWIGDMDMVLVHPWVGLVWFGFRNFHIYGALDWVRK